MIGAMILSMPCIAFCIVHRLHREVGILANIKLTFRALIDLDKHHSFLESNNYCIHGVMCGEE